MNYLILMADIINSSHSEGGALMSAFSGLVDKVNKKFGTGILSPLTITLGDEYQGIVADAQTAADIIFFIDEESLVTDPQFRLRHVVHFGDVETPINRKESHAMLGPGLTRAREILGEIKSGDTEISISGFTPGTDERLSLAFRLYRAFYNDWPEKDRQIAYDFIQKHDYKILAGMYGKDPSTMWRKERTLKMKDFYTSRALINLLISDV